MKREKYVGNYSNSVNQNNCRKEQIMKATILKSVFVILPIIILVSSCSKDPTSPEPVNNKPRDGYWTGQTNQNKDVLFNVCEKGTEVDSGFVINMYISESWGYGYAKYTRTVSTDIEKEEFSFDGNGITVQGEFHNRTDCEGKFALAGTTGYPYYLPFSVSGTWTADWESSQPKRTSISTSLPNLEKGISGFEREEQIDENTKISLTYYLVK